MPALRVMQILGYCRNFKVNAIQFPTFSFWSKFFWVMDEFSRFSSPREAFAAQTRCPTGYGLIASVQQDMSTNDICRIYIYGIYIRSKSQKCNVAIFLELSVRRFLKRGQGNRGEVPDRRTTCARMRQANRQHCIFLTCTIDIYTYMPLFGTTEF